ncbi:hypothetical protein HanIR_Chr08g0377301 [Helianthus annuus]|nr:hypothetical protein HanIR_Chr08g0377301 [Helianthus annuus]
MKQKTTMKNQQASRNIISKRSTLFLCICIFVLDYSSPKGKLSAFGVLYTVLQVPYLVYDFEDSVLFVVYDFACSEEALAVFFFIKLTVTTKLHLGLWREFWLAGCQQKWSILRNDCSTIRGYAISFKKLFIIDLEWSSKFMLCSVQRRVN